LVRYLFAGKYAVEACPNDHLVLSQTLPKSRQFTKVEGAEEMQKAE